MNVFTIEGYQGKAMVMESLMNDFPNGNYTAEKDNCAFIINDYLTLFSHVLFSHKKSFAFRTFNLGWNKDSDTKKIALSIYATTMGYGFKNIFIYTNELRNSHFIADLITEFNRFFVEGSDLNNGNVFIFCQPNF